MLGVLFVIGVLFLVADIRNMKRVVPSGHAATLTEYLEWQPEATEFVDTTFGGKRHIIAYGPDRASELASGLPAYVFDETGRLVDWSTDIGDDPEFDARWSAQPNLGNANFGRDAAEELAEDLATP